MRLWISVYLTHPSLDALSLSWPDDAAGPLVVLEREAVVAVTPAAAQLGVRPGMRKKGAGALAPHAVFIQRDAGRERQLLDATALAMLQYTPEVAPGPDTSVLLDVGASLRAFGGPLALCRRVRRTLEQLGCRARVGMAPTAHGAWLLAARATPGPRRVLRQDRLLRRMAGLPCLLLPPARPHRAWLDGIGCRTLAALMRLPRAGLQRRCGHALPHMLDQACGQAPELFDWIRAPLQFSARLEPIARLEHTAAVLIVARRLVQQLAGWLGATHTAASAIVLLLEHERGRHARPPTRLTVALAQPGWQADHLLRLLKEHLERLALEAPAIAVALHADQLVSRAAPSEALFTDPGGTPADHDRLLELLTARLGADRVLAARPRADHRPETANHWQPALPPSRAAPQDSAPDAERPLWLLAHPIALVLRRNRPYYGTPLRLLRGPERLESGWWDGAPVSRDYFVAESEDGIRYWLYLDQALDEPRWYLHGLYA
ncbi:MAG: DNA polymerase Y family protein [Alcaligenaceae bacterium]|nr:DNA polymerase Y family protein [Alcaligenaceae bacterium SAGV5]MPS53505.1 DNA polymerase Y family protein [Alcaligenaceae bacterium SAGV3]MPT58205.1 DNA polymerase Y family protein [Alcaligenaceae bacterium]